MEDQGDSLRPEAATDEPASPLHLPAPPPAGGEDAAYWRGYHAALAAAAAPGADERDSPRVRRMRCDGFTGAKQVVFLESIAAGFTVAEAAERAGVSPTTAYNFRNRRQGRAFNIGWEAASRRARRPYADMLQDRGVAGQTDTSRDKDGALVGTRHRHDNRLAMAMLTRLDRKAEAYREDERLVTVVAEEFEELLDIIEAGGDAEHFIHSRTPPARDYGPRDRAPEPDEARKDHYDRHHLYDRVAPADIDISDIDPDGMGDWTDDQWARAERSGLLDRLEAEEARKSGDGAANGARPAEANGDA
jgi:hypothetical protein